MQDAVHRLVGEVAVVAHAKQRLALRFQHALHCVLTGSAHRRHRRRRQLRSANHWHRRKRLAPTGDDRPAPQLLSLPSADSALIPTSDRSPSSTRTAVQAAHPPCGHAKICEYVPPFAAVNVGNAAMMADRIADPWGARTPYPQAGIGRFAWTRTSTARSIGGCSRRACCARTGARSTSACATGGSSGVRGRGRGSRQPRPARAEGPVRLAGQQLGRPAAAPARAPRRRVARGELGRGDGAWSPSARASCSRRRASGALGFYTSGQLFLEDYYTLALVARGGIGTNHLDGNTRLCTATAGQSLKETFGCDGQPGRRARHRVLRHDPARRDQHGRDADGAVDARARSAARPRPAALDRDRPARDGVGAGGGGASRDQAGNEPGRPERARSAADRERLDRPRVPRARTRSGSTRSSRPSPRTRRSASPRSAASPPTTCAAPREILGEAEHLLTFVLQGVYQSHQATASACAANNINLLRGMIGKPGGGDPADERPADRAEHARDRLQRRPARLPQLAERGARRRARRSSGTSSRCRSRTGARRRTRWRSSATPSRARSSSSG